MKASGFRGSKPLNIRCWRLIAGPRYLPPCPCIVFPNSIWPATLNKILSYKEYFFIYFMLLSSLWWGGGHLQTAQTFGCNPHPKLAKKRCLDPIPETEHPALNSKSLKTDSNRSNSAGSNLSCQPSALIAQPWTLPQAPAWLPISDLPLIIAVICCFKGSSRLTLTLPANPFSKIGCRPNLAQDPLCPLSALSSLAPNASPF